MPQNNNDNYIELLSELVSLRKIGEVPRAYIRTYGCQQNVADSEKIKGILVNLGFSFTNTPDNADLILFNTCAVREHAEDRVFGNVGALKALKRKHPSLTIVLCGCMMEQKHIANRIYKSFPFVNLVFGTHSLHNFAKFYYNTLTFGKRIIAHEDDDNLIHEDIPIHRDGTFKAFLPIMYGCNNFCTYCVVPHVRGRERSRSSKAILQDAKKLIESGYKDITLLGQNVNSYGKGLDEDINFAQLLHKIDEIEGDYWIRFMTSHPKDCSKELIDTIAASKHIERHLHLPFQSGSSRILEAMNRKYTREKYLNIVNYAKEKIDNLQLTSDVIVGFPDESYEDFSETVSLIKEVGFSSLYTFIFSKRVGTPAYNMEDKISSEEKSKWFQELIKVQENISAERSKKMIGKTFKVLVESEIEKNNELNTRTSGNIIIEATGSAEKIGTFQNCIVTDAGNYVLKGKLI